MTNTREIEQWLISKGWKFKDFWWVNPLFPGKRFDWQQAIRVQESIETRSNVAVCNVIIDEFKDGKLRAPRYTREVPYWKGKKAAG